MIILLLILNITILNALTAAFLLSLFRKVGIIEYIQVHGNDFFLKCLIAIFAYHGGQM